MEVCYNSKCLDAGIAVTTPFLYAHLHSNKHGYEPMTQAGHIGIATVLHTRSHEIFALLCPKQASLVPPMGSPAQVLHTAMSTQCSASSLLLPAGLSWIGWVRLQPGKRHFLGLLAGVDLIKCCQVLLIAPG